MMSGDHDEVSRASSFDCAHPLLCVKCRGVENARISSAITPFPILKGIGTKMNDDAKLEVLPLDLPRGRLDIRKILRPSD